METITQKNEIELPLSSTLEINRVALVKYDNHGTSFKSISDATNDFNEFIKRNQEEKLMVDFDYFKEDVVFIFVCLPNALHILFCDRSAKPPILFSAIDPHHSKKQLESLANKYMSFYIKDKEFTNQRLRYFDVTQKILALRIINQTTENKYIVEITAETGETFIQENWINPIEIQLFDYECMGIEVGMSYRIWVHTFGPWVGSIMREI